MLDNWRLFRTPFAPGDAARMTDATAAAEPADAEDAFTEDQSVIWDEDIYPNLHEHRIPDCGAPYPDGLRDPLSHELIDTARWFLVWLVNGFWSPASLARLERVWQWRKFDLLDWLRPIELLLRRLLLIEALGLILSQALPPVRPRSAKGQAGKQASRPKPPFDPDYPETWRVSFSAIPGRPSSGSRRPRRRLPPIDLDRVRCHPITPLRYRRVMHNAVPLALRLEAVIRVTLDPASYARRLALRLQRTRNPNASLLITPRRRDFPRPAPRDALRAAGERGAVLHHAWWSSA
jgi:hypothetical protein